MNEPTPRHFGRGCNPQGALGLSLEQLGRTKGVVALRAPWNSELIKQSTRCHDPGGSEPGLSALQHSGSGLVTELGDRVSDAVMGFGARDPFVGVR